VTTLGLPGIHVPNAGEADSDDQHTPRWLLDMVDELWPCGIGTDPAWSPTCGVKAQLTYDGSCPEQDGLTQPWHGETWLNGPYSDLAPWATRMAEHAVGHREGLMLCNVATSVAWFRRVRPGQPQGCRAVAFFDRRISFIKDGVERRGNDREQMMLWWGPAERLRIFRRVFGRVAWIAV
jgi:hypothetical protein